eukprot:Rhum_TRINITY_DN1519_c0_g1::Rhum_TRINITY_DN1519_c0_g1_i1::g.4384::m.4384
MVVCQALLLLCLRTAVACADTLVPVTVLPLGDSITQGVDPNLSYRAALHSKAKAKGYDLRFVGAVKGTCYRGFKPEREKIVPYNRAEVEAVPAGVLSPYHEGHCGFTTGDWLAYTAKGGGLVEPAAGVEAVLLHIGTNDVINQIRTKRTTKRHLPELDGGTAKNIQTLVEWAANAYPHSHVYVAKIIPNMSPLLTNYLNNRIAEGVAKAAAQGLRVSVVGVQGFAQERHTVDTTHPNAEGEGLLADAWLAALEELLSTKKAPPKVPSASQVVAASTQPESGANASGSGAPLAGVVAAVDDAHITLTRDDRAHSLVRAAQWAGLLFLLCFAVKQFKNSRFLKK